MFTHGAESMYSTFKQHGTIKMPKPRLINYFYENYVPMWFKTCFSIVLNF